MGGRQAPGQLCCADAETGPAALCYACPYLSVSVELGGCQAGAPEHLQQALYEVVCAARLAPPHPPTPTPTPTPTQHTPNTHTHTPAEVVRSADLLSYTAEEGARFLGEGQLLASDSFPGQDRTKLCLASKVGGSTSGACAPLGACQRVLCFGVGVGGCVVRLGGAPLVPGHVFCGYFTTPASRGTLTSGTSCSQVPLGVILCIPPFNYPGESCIARMCHYMRALVAVLSTVPAPKLPQYTPFYRT